MTSDQIQNEIIHSCADTPNYFELVRFFREIAYHLAVLNERNVARDEVEVETSKLTFKALLQTEGGLHPPIEGSQP